MHRTATNQAEAESEQALLLEAGTPSMLPRSPGVDVPDMLAPGRRPIDPVALHENSSAGVPAADRCRWSLVAWNAIAEARLLPTDAEAWWAPMARPRMPGSRPKQERPGRPRRRSHLARRRSP